MATTLQDIMFAVRSEANELQSDFILDDELRVYINSSYLELYDLIIDDGATYRLSLFTGSVAVNQDSITAPDDFYRIKGIDVVIGNLPWTIEPIVFDQRNQRGIYGTTPFYYPQLRVNYLPPQGNVIKFVPAIAASGQYNLWYYPYLTKLVFNADTIDPNVDFNGWWEYIVVDAAIRCKQKGDYPADLLLARKADLKSRIQRTAPKRDMNRPYVVPGLDEQGDGWVGLPFGTWSR